MQWTKLVASLSLTYVLHFGEFVLSDDCLPSCNFTDANETTPCRVYGLVDSRPVPFYRANVTCLEAYNVSETRLSLEDLLIVCPNEKGTNADVTALTNLLRESGRVEGNFLKSQFPQFFEENNSTKDYVFRSTIQDRQGQILDCQKSEFFCWQAVQIYFGSSDEGKAKFAELCGQLYKRFIAQSIREQAAIRELLCGLDDAPICEPLFDQVHEYVTNETCSALGIPANQSDIPTDCGSSSDNNNQGTSGTVGLVGWKYAALIALMTTWLQYYSR